MQTLNYDETESLPLTSRPAFTRAYALTIAAYLLAVAAAVLIG